MFRLCIAALAVGLTACEMPVMGDSSDAALDGGEWGVLDGGRPPFEDLRINEMQMRATVNSYHEFFFDLFPEVAWRHPRIDVQLDAGIRVFDFDVVGDRNSWIGIYPATSEWVGDAENNCGFVQNGELQRGSLVGCLWDLQRWCDAHPDHPLITIFVGEGDLAGQPPQLAWQLDDLEAEFIVGLTRERLLVPSDVRGEHASVWAAIQADGWPTVEETRGKVMVVLNDRGPTRFAYLMNGGEDPADPLMFVVGDPATAGSDPVGDEVVFSFEPTETYEFETDMADIEQMQALIGQGFLVHAITDDPEKAAQFRREGVHFVGSRFPEQVLGPVEQSPTTCNPVTSRGWCEDGLIERR